MFNNPPIYPEVTDPKRFTVPTGYASWEDVVKYKAKILDLLAKQQQFWRTTATEKHGQQQNRSL